ncbi:MAG: hypothetical protein ABFD66_02065 [Smithella sp.]
MKRASDLTEKEREWFTFLFYQKIDSVLPEGLSLDDVYDNPRPWGCPWSFSGNRLLAGDTIEEMVDSYIEEVKDEIAIVLQNEKEEKEI